MSLPPPIAMSLELSVVEALGAMCDDGDPDERSRADAAACVDRFGRWAADDQSGGGANVILLGTAVS